MSIASNPPFENINTPEPTIEQRQGTAASDLPKLTMGISYDTLRPFVEVDKEAFIHYNTSPGHPTLAPTGRMRLASAEDIPDGEWKEVAQALINQMPLQIQSKLTALRSLSVDERNNSSFEKFDQWNALDNVVNMTAKLISFVAFAASINRTDDAKNEALVNSEAMSAISSSMADQAEQLAQMVKESLKKRLNDPEFDACSFLISRFKPFVEELAKKETNEKQT